MWSYINMSVGEWSSIAFLEEPLLLAPVYMTVAFSMRASKVTRSHGSGVPQRHV